MYFTQKTIAISSPSGFPIEILSTTVRSSLVLSLAPAWACGVPDRLVRSSLVLSLAPAWACGVPDRLPGRPTPPILHPCRRSGRLLIRVPLLSPHFADQQRLPIRFV
jgi:hypothetical protein